MIIGRKLTMLNSRSTIREQNEHIVLTEIINNPEISRAEISKNANLNKATVSEIVRKFIDEEIVIETGIGASSTSGGRKPILLKINKRAGISLNFDIRYDKISYMATYLDGETILLTSETRKINKENVVSIIEEIVNKFIRTSSFLKKTPFGLIGIAIAIHGIISENKITFTPYYDLDQIDLAKELNQLLDLPIYIENEANLSALSEASLDTQHKNLITMSIHTGVGAGIIIDEKLYRGCEGRSGEIGHTILYPNGMKCPCGNYGCLEQYCSETAVLRFYREREQNDCLTIEDLIKNFHNDEKNAVQIIEDFAKNLSIGLINLIGSYGPDVVYISGSLTSKMPSIINMINRHLSSTIYQNAPIKVSKIASHASLYGATVMNIQNFLDVEAIKVDQKYSFELMEI